MISLSCEHFGSIENAEDVVGVVSEVDVAVLTCNFSKTFFLTVFPGTGSFFLFECFVLFWL